MMSQQEKFEQVDETPEVYTSKRQTRRERIEERRANRRQGGFGWLAGLVLIVIGVLYLLNDTGNLPTFTNWWALFLLLPGVGVLSAAVGAYRQNGGHWTSQVIGLFLGSLLFFGITAVFLLELDFSWLWPLFLIGGGLLLLMIPLLTKNKSMQ